MNSLVKFNKCKIQKIENKRLYTGRAGSNFCSKNNDVFCVIHHIWFFNTIDV